MNGLDLRALEIFRAVALEGNVSAAARKLNRVQSNVSTRVRQLEDRLGKTLFLRRSRGLTLTPDGEVLLTYAERFLRLSTETAEALGTGKPVGAFRIGTMESTAASRLPAVLSRYHALYRDVEITVETDTAAGLADRLLNCDLEAAFIAEPVTFDWAASTPVFAERLVLVAPASFPPLDHTDQISGRTVIAFESGCAYRRYLQQWLLDRSIVPGNIMTVGSYLAMLACVSAGTGYAVVPQSVLDMVASEGEFRRYDLPDAYAAITTLLCWRADYASAKLDALRALLPESPG